MGISPRRYTEIGQLARRTTFNTGHNGLQLTSLLEGTRKRLTLSELRVAQPHQVQPNIAPGFQISSTTFVSESMGGQLVELVQPDTRAWHMSHESR